MRTDIRQPQTRQERVDGREQHQAHGPARRRARHPCAPQRHSPAGRWEVLSENSEVSAGSRGVRLLRTHLQLLSIETPGGQRLAQPLDEILAFAVGSAYMRSHAAIVVSKCAGR